MENKTVNFKNLRRREIKCIIYEDKDCNIIVENNKEIINNF
jgi:hypothetical protein